MKQILLLSLLSLFAISSISAQEIYGKHMWELVGDNNSNGKADSGDTVQYITVITNSSLAPETINLENVLKDFHISLIAGTVIASTGNVLTGNKDGDSEVFVSNMHLKPLTENEKVEFHAVISDNLPDDITSIINNSSFSGTFGTINTNVVRIPFNDDDHDVASTFIFPRHWFLAIPLLVFVLLGINLLRQIMPKLSY